MMSLLGPFLLLSVVEPATAPQISFVPVLESAADAEATAPTISAPPRPLDTAPTSRDVGPLDELYALDFEDPRFEKADVRPGHKLLLTNGVATLEGSSGGGLARWSTIGGRQMEGRIGFSSHATVVELPDFGWRSYGMLFGLGDRLELSIARADFDTREAGKLLGIGQGYTFNLETFGAKLRVAGDLVYGETWLPQIAIGVEHKRSRDGVLVRALGAAESSGTDYTLSATKLLLTHSLLVSGTLRYTKANELGLLGFGSVVAGSKMQFEGSLGYQLSHRAVFGVEYRSKPDNLGLGDDDWMDIFAAYSLTNHLTLTAAFVDLGSIATFSAQRGGFLSAQVAF